VTLVARPSWIRRFDEYYCRECGFQQANRSRSRGFFERYVLPLLLLQVVRCERCYHRGYALRTIAVIERFQPGSKPPQNQSPGGSERDSRIA
jgi:ribosomal protein L37E